MAVAAAPVAPFIVRPTRINNYTHLIALLRIKQEKYSRYACKSVCNDYADVLNENIEAFDYNEIIEGHLHEKLSRKFENLRAETEKRFSKQLNKRIEDIKKDNDQRIYSVKIGNVKEVEESLFNRHTKYSFRDDLLFDLYGYLIERQEPLRFLENSYLRYVRLFMDAQGRGCSDEQPSGRAVVELVKAFTVLRFNKEEYSVEAYEGRYLWAELFVLMRIGRFDLVKQLLSEYEIFFEFLSQQFKTACLNFCDRKSVDFVYSLSSSDDQFKRFLFQLVDGKAKSNGSVISTVEDFLWMKMLGSRDSTKEILRDMAKFDNLKVSFMVYLLTKKYKKAIDVLLRSDFSVVAKFFLLRELCLEQALDSDDTERATPMPIPMLRNTARMDETSSSYSLISEQSQSCRDRSLSEVNPVFLNFMFAIAAKLSSNENKVKFIEMLRHHADYYDVVPYYLIKYGLFDLLGQTEDGSGQEYFLDNELAERTISQLIKKGDKFSLVKFYRLISDDKMIDLLISIVEEAILFDLPVESAIVEQYLNRLMTRENRRLRDFYSLYVFSRSGDIASLRASVIFSDESVDLSPYKYAIEKVMPVATDVVRRENEHEMAKRLFKLCGILELSEECCSRVSKDLILVL